MKKALLTTAVLSALASTTAGAVTVYNEDGTKLSIGGRAEVRGVFGDAVEGTMEDASRARINFAGETQISEELTGFGFVEYQLNDGDTDDGTELTNRYIYVGFGTVYGDFSYGKQATANVQVTDFSDIGEYHTGINQLIDAAADNQSNVFLYTAAFNALTVQADYQAVEDKDADAYALSAVYGFDFGLDLGASYSAQDAAISSAEAYQATLGAAYTVKKLYVAVTYATGETAKDSEFDSVEAVAKYQFTDEFALLGIYGKTEENNADKEDRFALEANYRFSPALNVYASYELNNLDKDEAEELGDDEDELVLGAKYTF